MLGGLIVILGVGCALCQGRIPAKAHISCCPLSKYAKIRQSSNNDKITLQSNYLLARFTILLIASTSHRPVCTHQQGYFSIHRITINRSRGYLPVYHAYLGSLPGIVIILPLSNPEFNSRVERGKSSMTTFLDALIPNA